jgi:hypothetical protein
LINDNFLVLETQVERDFITIPCSPQYDLLLFAEQHARLRNQKNFSDFMYIRIKFTPFFFVSILTHQIQAKPLLCSLLAACCLLDKYIISRFE